MSEAEKQKGWLGDAAMRASIIGVAGSALVLSAGALAFFGKDAAIGIAIGGALATVNLWVFAQIGEAFLSRRGNTAPWAAIGMVKLAALFCAVWLILRSGYATGLSLAVGYGALPIGITLGSLFGPKPPEDGPNKDGTTDDTP
jgi:ATP synthase I subunit